MEKNNGGLAFPLPMAVVNCDEILDARDYCKENGGATLRDYFVAHIGDDIDGADFADEIKEKVLGRTCPHWKDDPIGMMQFEAEFRAAWRGMRADAMIAEREKDGE